MAVQVATLQVFKLPSGMPSPASSRFYYTKKSRLCIGDPDKVNKILGVEHYITAWPKIPIEELHASSVQHPYHPNMRSLAGAAMFASIEHVFELETMMRFRDPVLRQIFEKMRALPRQGPYPSW